MLGKELKVANCQQAKKSTVLDVLSLLNVLSSESTLKLCKKEVAVVCNSVHNSSSNSNSTFKKDEIQINKHASK